MTDRNGTVTGKRAVPGSAGDAAEVRWFVPGRSENIAVRYGGIVLCSSSIAFCR